LVCAPDRVYRPAALAGIADRARSFVISCQPGSAIPRSADISEVRRVARTICEGSGARTFITHTIVTIVSEAL
jgi:hypothetical protein